MHKQDVVVIDLAAPFAIVFYRDRRVVLGDRFGVTASTETVHVSPRSLQVEVPVRSLLIRLKAKYGERA